MKNTEIILLFVVLILGAFLLRWAHLFGLKQKSHYEGKAANRLESELSQIKNELNEYVFYRYIKWGIFNDDHHWGKSSFTEMKNEIIESCSKDSGGHGTVYSPAIYSIYIKKGIKKVYYVVGKSNYDFNDIK